MTENTYLDNSIRQTILWMNGISKHFNNECCIDFSCCYPNLKFSKERRLKVGKERIKLYQELKYAK